MNHLRPAFVMVALFTLLTGLAFPLAFTAAATALVPGPANGTLVERDGHVVGSALIGQNFTAPQYFHPRPSATTDTDPADATKTVAAPYNASGSTGSNLGPTSKALVDRVAADVAASGATNVAASGATDVAAAGAAPVPADAVTTSASGLDPDISPANASRQVARVATARGWAPERVAGVLAQQTQPRFFGLFGEPRVNVLLLNLALDAAGRS